MPIRIQCPLCDKQYQAPDHLAGKKMKCRRCSEEILIDAANAAPPAEDEIIDSRAAEAQRARKLAGKREYRPRLERGPAPLRGTSLGHSSHASTARTMPEFGGDSATAEADFELDRISRVKWTAILFLPLAILVIAPFAYFGMLNVGVTISVLLLPFVIAVTMMVTERLYIVREAGQLEATAVTRFLGMPFRTEEIDMSGYKELYIEHEHTRNLSMLFIAVMRFFIIYLCIGLIFAMIDRSESETDELDENFTVALIGPEVDTLVICNDNRFTKISEVADKASRLFGFLVRSGLPEGMATRFEYLLRK